MRSSFRGNPTMAKTKHEIQALLASANTEPRHRFGQNFMIDQNLVRIVADAGEIGADDLVIEVGPGTGRSPKNCWPVPGESSQWKSIGTWPACSRKIEH